MRAANDAFARAYPALARWVELDGSIEIGRAEFSRSLVRALDRGGMVWEGGGDAGSIDEALSAMDAAFAQWMRAQLGL